MGQENNGTYNEETFLAMEQVVLNKLSQAFQEAMALRSAGKTEAAEKALLEILKLEPRLAEPRIELAHIAFSNGDIEQAESQTRQALNSLRANGQWTEDLKPEVLLSYTLNLLGEILISRFNERSVDEDDFTQYETAWNEAASLFSQAVEVDPENREARSNVLRFAPVKRSRKSTD